MKGPRWPARFRPRAAAAVSLAVTGALACTGAGWFLASAFESPAQREAAATPPAQKPLTAVVERGNLTETVSFRATVEREERTTTPLPSHPEGDSVVTAAATAVGSALRPGSVVTEVNGRPIIALTGSFRFYRDLHPADTGPDVKQLQQALTAAGHRVSASGTWGDKTTSAFSALFTAAGRRAPVKAAAADGASPETAAPEARAAAPSASLTPYLPRSEFLVMPVLPATLVGAPAVGDTIGGDTVITTEHGAPRLTASVPNLIAARVHPSATGAWSASVGDQRGAGAQRSVTVTRVGEHPDDASETPVALGSADGTTPLDESLLGVTGTVTIELSRLATDELIVPTIAVSPGGKSPAHVFAERDGEFERIGVTEVATLDGRSAVRPVEANALRAGDRVRIST